MKPEIKQKVKKAIKILNRGFIIFIILRSFTGAILYAGGYKSYLRHYVKKEEIVFVFEDDYKKEIIELFYPKYYAEDDYEERHTRSSS